MSTIQTQINLVHLQSGIPVPSVTQRTSVGEQFAANAISVGTTDETIPLGDVTTPKQVMVKFISGDLLRIGLDGTTYPFELVNVDEATLFRLAVESIVETSTVTTLADSPAGTLSGKYFTLGGEGGEEVAVWFDLGANAANTITYGTPVAGDEIMVGASVFTCVASAPAAGEFTSIAQLTSLIDAIPGVTASFASGEIFYYASVPGLAGNATIATELDPGNLGDMDFFVTEVGSDSGGYPPSPSVDRRISVNFAAGASNSAIAAAIAAAMDADTVFSATATGAAVTIVATSPGTRTNISAGDSGFIVSTTQQGAASPVIHLKSTGTSQVVVAVAPH